MKVDPSHIFISTQDLTYSYGDLNGFADELQRKYDKLVRASSTSVILILSDKTFQTALLISACFIRQIPIVVIPNDSSGERIRRTIKETGAIACFKNKLVRELDLKITEIEIPDFKPYPYFSTDPLFSSLDPDKLFAILYTSGTTSEAKAVPLKYRQVLHAARSSSLNLPLDTEDEWLLNLPLHHIGGISILIRSILNGSKVYLSSSQNSATLKKVLLTRDSITHVSLVPTQLKRLLDDTYFKVGPNFRAILLGGGPISARVHQLAIQRDIPVIPSFGMTETAAQCTAVPFESMDNAPFGTSGKPLDGIEISLRSDITSSSSKLLWIRGPQLFDGYLDEILNINSFDSEGWFNTGDYASIDENGYLYIEMRRSDRIVTGGENVNPFYVEEVLETHQNIAEAGVFGIEDDEWGQVVIASIVLKDKKIPFSIKDIKEFLKSRLPGFMIPKKVLLVDHLPRTASGKLIRSELLKLL